MCARVSSRHKISTRADCTTGISALVTLVHQRLSARHDDFQASRLPSSPRFRRLLKGALDALEQTISEERFFNGEHASPGSAPTDVVVEVTRRQDDLD